MGVIRSSFRSMMAAILIALSLSGVSIASAQVQDFEPHVYQSQLTGFDIEASGPEYSIVNVELQHYPNGEGEVIELEAAVGISFLEISLYDDTDSPVDTIDVYLGSLEGAAESMTILDSGIVGDHQFSFAQIKYNGFEFFFLIQVQEDVVGNVDIVETILTTEDDLVSMLASAQEEVTIDGAGFMANLDASDLHAMIAGGGSIAEDSSVDSTPDLDIAVSLSSAEIVVSLGSQVMFDGPVSRGEAVDSVQIDGPNLTTMVAVGETGLDANTVLDEYQAGVVNTNPNIELVADGEAASSIWRLLWMPQGDGTGEYMFLVVDTTTYPGYELLIASTLPADSVGESIEHIQKHVLIDGEPGMIAIDAAEIQAIVDEFSSPGNTSGDDAATSTADESDGEVGDPRNDARLPDDRNTTENTGNTSETGEQQVPTEEPDAPAEETLTLTDSSWKGGVFGHLIEWNKDVWIFVPEHEEDITSNSDEGVDQIALHSNLGSGDAWLAISVYEPGDTTPDEYLDYWMSGEFVVDQEESNSGTTVEVLASRSRNGNAAVVVRYTEADGNEIILVRQVSVIESGEIVLVSMFAPVDEVQELFERSHTDVTVDGQPVLSVLTLSQLVRALEN